MVVHYILHPANWSTLTNSNLKLVSVNQLGSERDKKSENRREIQLGITLDIKKPLLGEHAL